jgi:hypothetical protein
MSAKIASTGPLREIHSASLLPVAGAVAAIVVMAFSFEQQS